MNLYKINKKLNRYILSIKNIENPNVYDLYKKLGKELMGRKIYTKSDRKKQYFNKSIIHKSQKHYIGLNREGFFAQNIVKIKEEERCLCVHGNSNRYQEIADKIIDNLGVKDFVFDVYNKKYLMEVNELYLSTIDFEELKFILSQII